MKIKIRLFRDEEKTRICSRTICGSENPTAFGFGDGATIDRCM